MQLFFRIVSVALSAALLATGCDFVRASFNKPTSRDLDSLRQVKADAERLAAIRSAAEKAAADSAARAVRDSQALCDSVPQNRYYVIAGAFTDSENVEKCSKDLVNDGYQVNSFKLRNGYTVVAILGTDNKNQAYISCSEYAKVAPSGVEPWVYDAGPKKQDSKFPIE